MTIAWFGIGSLATLAVVFSFLGLRQPRVREKPDGGAQPSHEGLNAKPTLSKRRFGALLQKRQAVADPPAA